MTTATETVREMMEAYDAYRAKWIAENGTADGFDAWFTQQVKGKYQPGQHVTCNGNPEGVVIGPYGNGMYEVRLWDGLRCVGDVCVDEYELDIEN